MSHDDIHTILYACDLGEGSEVALAYAIVLAGRLNATLQVLTVIDDARERSLVDLEEHVPQPALDAYHRSRGLHTLERIRSQIAAFYAARSGPAPHRPVTELLVREGDDVPRAILEAAEHERADLIVMASRGKGRLAGLLLGSATHDVLRETRRPLLLVPVGS